MTTTFNLNTFFKAFIGEDARAEFETLRTDKLMISAARFQMKAGYTADSMQEIYNDFSFNFCEQWINHGKPAPCMIGLPGAALIAAMRDIENANN
jgi:hypothetical protein